jgi:hypothetical protein
MIEESELDAHRLLSTLSDHEENQSPPDHYYYDGETKPSDMDAISMAPFSPQQINSLQDDHQINNLDDMVTLSIPRHQKLPAESLDSRDADPFSHVSLKNPSESNQLYAQRYQLKYQKLYSDHELETNIREYKKAFEQYVIVSEEF